MNQRIPGIKTTLIKNNSLMNNIKMKILPNLNEMAQIIKEIETLMLDNNFSNEDISNVSLCLSEILTNIVSYAELSPDQSIEILTEYDNEKIIFTIEDNGTEKPKDISIEAQNDPLTIHGRGQWLVKALSDEFTYERKNQKNITVLKKIRSNPENK